ncbi:VOC family protein [Parasulfitobacter algicola]|uniref:VOC family protein n=1 Tax=Parasulfitobacter algicola TaxID=2614809 RepID=A0ABX2IVP0_9RHOB|nr:VOC family protein [Sulfitobacter algicola]NSX57001.1 VOC family protein [Sulfitobacter algicola]
MEAKTGLGAIRSMDYVILLCDDIERMKKFYREVLSFEVEDEAAGTWVGFRVGTLYLGLRPRGRSYDGARIPEKSAGAQISFRVPPADVDAAHEELLAKGVKIIEGPTNQDWTHRTLFFHDPEFNIIEIYADIHPHDTLDNPSGVHLLVHGQ